MSPVTSLAVREESPARNENNSSIQSISETELKCVCVSVSSWLRIFLNAATRDSCAGVNYYTAVAAAAAVVADGLGYIAMPVCVRYIEGGEDE